MRIDSHQHYWQIARGDYGWLTPALTPIYRDFLPSDLASMLAEARIDHTIAVQAAPTEAETAWLLALAAQTPSIAGVVGWTDFDAEDCAERIRAVAGNPLLVGLRPMIHDIADPDWILGRGPARALHAMVEQGLVFDALVRPVHLKQLLSVAKAYPDLPIVIDHGAKPFIARREIEPWLADMQALAARSNVVVKLSGLVTEAGRGWQARDLAPYMAAICAAFGLDRVLFGSDWPVLNLAGDYPGWLRIVEAYLGEATPQEREAVMGGNARRIYLANRGRISC